MKPKYNVQNMLDSPANIIHLQQLMKADPDGYKFELCTQYNRFCRELDVLNINPSVPNKSLADLVLFLGQVSHLYKSDLERFPQQIITALKTHAVTLDQDVRLALCRALVLLRNRNIIPPLDLLNLFFGLLHCKSKFLRVFLQSHIISDIKNLNSRHKNHALNTTLQNFMFGQMEDETNAIAVKMSLDVMVELYRKNIWHDAKTVNVIALACFSKITKVLVAAVKFFLGADEVAKEESDSEDDDGPQIKDIVMSNKVNKKSKKRKWMLQKTKKQIQKSKKKNKVPTFNVSAIHLLHDPHDMADKLFKMVSKLNERYEVKLMVMDLISRLVGIHQLFLFNFYSFLIKYLQPHQSEVTRILLFAAQASHDLVPPDIIQPVVQTITYNFVADRNSGEVMAVGLNAIREICARCPLAINQDLLQDLVQYRSHRDKSVHMAARSLMLLYRDTNPQLLNRKDRGKPTQATQELKPITYGALNADLYIPGADALDEEEIPLDENQKLQSSHKNVGKTTNSKDFGTKLIKEERKCETKSTPLKEKEDTSEDESDIESDECLENDREGEEEITDEEEEEQSDSENEEESCSNESGDNDDESNELNKKEKPCTVSQTSQPTSSKTQDFVLREDDAEAKKAKAIKMSYTKIFTQEDFRKIKAAEIAKHVHGALPKKLKRKSEEPAPSLEDSSDEEEKGELPSLGDIERVHKSRKMDKESRLATAKALKEGKEKNVGKKRDGKNNRVKSKNKPFMMVKHKVQKKAKRSFRERQLALKRSLIKNQKSKYK